MSETLNAHQLIQLAQCLTRMQAMLTDYELTHYADLGPDQKNSLEETLTRLASAAGRIYAYSVQLIFLEATSQLQQLKKATEELKKFLKTVQKIQQVLDVVSIIGSLADAIISHDVEGITVGIDQFIQMVANN
jgi:hypothetical protein